MKTIHELHAFADAYSRAFAHVSRRDAEAVAGMLAVGSDEVLIYDQVPEAQSVMDAYWLWSAAREYQGENE